MISNGFAPRGRSYRLRHQFGQRSISANKAVCDPGPPMTLDDWLKIADHVKWPIAIGIVLTSGAREIGHRPLTRQDLLISRAEHRAPRVPMPPTLVTVQ